MLTQANQSLPSRWTSPANGSLRRRAELQQDLARLKARAKAVSAKNAFEFSDSVAARALLLAAIFDIDSERVLEEELEQNLLFRWFLDLESPDDEPSYEPGAVIASLQQVLGSGVARHLFFEVAGARTADF